MLKSGLSRNTTYNRQPLLPLSALNARELGMGRCPATELRNEGPGSNVVEFVTTPWIERDSFKLEESKVGLSIIYSSHSGHTDIKPLIRNLVTRFAALSR